MENLSPLTLNILQHIFSGLIPALTIVVFGSSLVGIKIRAYQILLLLLTSWIPFRIVGTYHIPIGLNSLVLIVCMAILCFLILKVNNLTAIFIPVTGVFIWAAIESAITDLYYYLFKIDQSMFATKEYVLAKFSLIIIVGAILLLLSKLIERYKLNLMRLVERIELSTEEERNNFSNKLLMLIILLLIPILVLICMNAALEELVLTNSLKNYWEIFSSIDIFIVFVLGGSTIYGIFKIFNIMKNEYTAKESIRQLSYLEELITSIRKQRHDFDNHLQTIYGLIGTNEHAKVKDYIKKISNVVSVTGELIKTDNPVISSLLYQKIGLVESKNIDIELTVIGSLKNMSISNYELNSVIGNLLDNAIEAVESNEPANKKITLKLKRTSDSLKIEVSNSGLVPGEMVENMLELNYSTKGHPGLGLTIIKEITEKHGGNLDVSINGDQITFCSNIPLMGWR